MPSEKEFSYGHLQLADASTTKYRDGRLYSCVQLAPKGKVSERPHIVFNVQDHDLAQWLRPGVTYELVIREQEGTAP